MPGPGPEEKPLRSTTGHSCRAIERYGVGTSHFTVKFTDENSGKSVETNATIEGLPTSGQID
jgi:hypothetical protein